MSPVPVHRPWIRLATVFLLAALPWMLSAYVTATLLLLVGRFGLRIPVIDEWASLGDTLSALDSGEGFWRMLWAQHNEHRLPIARLVDMVVVTVAKGNLFLGLYVNALLAIGTAALLGVVAQKQVAVRYPRLGPWMPLAMAVLVLSPSQMETWLFPQPAQTIQNLFVVLGFLALAQQSLTWRGIGWAALCGVLAVGSFSSGLLFWPVAILPLALSSGRRAWRRVPVWIAFTAVVWGVYFTGFHKPSMHPSLSAWLANPLGLIQFFLALLGNVPGAAVLPQSPLAPLILPIVGAIGCLLLGPAILVLARDPASRAPLGFWLAMATYGIACAASISVSRLGWGIILAFSSRYITLVWPFWTAVVVLPLLASASWQSGTPRQIAFSANRLYTVAGIAAAWIVIVVGVGSINTFMQRWAPIAQDRAAATYELPDLCQGNTQLVSHLGPIPAIDHNLPIMVRHHVVVLPEDTLPAEVATRGAVPPGAIESVRLEAEPRTAGRGRCLRLTGWTGVTPAGPSGEVLLVARGRLLKRGLAGHRRAHVGPDYDADPHPSVGWVMYLDTQRLRPEEDKLDAYTILPNADRPQWIGSVNVREITGGKGVR